MVKGASGGAGWRNLALYYNRNGTLAVAPWDIWYQAAGCNVVGYGKSRLRLG